MAQKAVGSGQLKATLLRINMESPIRDDPVIAQQFMAGDKARK
jgi:hypothetical protein